MSIKESALTAISSITNGDFVRAVLSSGGSRRISAANLAKYVIETYANSSVGGSTQSVKSALDGLNTKTSGWRMAVYGVNNNANIDVPLSSTTRGLIFSTGAGATSRGILGFGVNSAGTVTSSNMVSASGLTFTNGTNKINVANSSGAYASMFVLWS